MSALPRPYFDCMPTGKVFTLDNYTLQSGSRRRTPVSRRLLCPHLLRTSMIWPASAKSVTYWLRSPIRRLVQHNLALKLTVRGFKQHAP